MLERLKKSFLSSRCPCPLKYSHSDAATLPTPFPPFFDIYFHLNRLQITLTWNLSNHILKVCRRLDALGIVLGLAVSSGHTRPWIATAAVGERKLSSLVWSKGFRLFPHVTQLASLSSVAANWICSPSQLSQSCQWSKDVQALNIAWGPYTLSWTGSMICHREYQD